MTTDQGRPTALAVQWTAPDTRQWVLAALLFGVLVVTGFREGGFWPGAAAVVAVASIGVLLAAAVMVPPDRRGVLVVGTILLLAAWWSIRAVTAGSPESFLPLGASMLAFAAAFAVTRGLSGRPRQLAALGVACLGAVIALLGFAGLVWRWFPLAMPAQGLWRLSSTLTYSDAAGLVLGMCLLVALGLDLWPPLVRVAVCLSAAGLLATQSRGAYVAVACACLLVPWRRYVRFQVPLAAGTALGVAAIFASAAAGPVPWLGALLVVAVLVSALAAREGEPFRGGTGTRVLVGAVVACAVAATLALLHHEVGLRALAPSDRDRSVEWSTALHQWRSAPIVGVGPDRLLHFHASDGTLAHFVHNEYLQVAADAGLVGLALLSLCALAVVRAVRRHDLLASCAVAALACWAVAGAFDFDWHLSVVGLLGGWCCGLAARREAADVGRPTRRIFGDARAS
jgi:O-Antigen ligase